ncbi:MAG TPA: formimidoylglutamate deiminase [Mycobacteriales bacterium]|nr:formimidoylglutamate deiminase [Mycobacteriales bacterium]
MPVTRLHAGLAYVDGRLAERVLLEIAGGRFTAVRPDSPADDAERLPGLTLPGFANGHSHAFHRALRGRAQQPGSFWSWREQMYAVAATLSPDSYLALARATYAEMALAGYTTVGEFHYLHHGPGGKPYAEANAMSAALVQAARDAGIRLTLLDTCYLAGGIDEPLDPVQRRFSDHTAEGWAARAAAFRPDPEFVRLGAAVHSVRAVPADQLPVVVEWAAERDAPLHVHLSEQRAENEACQAAYGRTPTRLLADAGALGSRATAVHATHLAPDDIPLLSGGFACFCPTTERDLADGIGPARALADAGVRLTLGSDGQAVIDPFEEARALENDERLAGGRRGNFSAAELLDTAAGHASLGWLDGGRIASGAPADLVTVDLQSPRLAGIDDPLAAVLFAGSAADVRQVIVGGRPIVRDGRHLLVDDVAGALRTAVAAVVGR